MIDFFLLCSRFRIGFSSASYPFLFFRQVCIDRLHFVLFWNLIFTVSETSGCRCSNRQYLLFQLLWPLVILHSQPVFSRYCRDLKLAQLGEGLRYRPTSPQYLLFLLDTFKESFISTFHFFTCVETFCYDYRRYFCMKLLINYFDASEFL